MNTTPWRRVVCVCSYADKCANLPQFSFTYSRRTFSVAGPMAWNSLLDFIRDPTSSTDCLIVYLKRTCSRVTSASSALGVLNDCEPYKSTHSLTHSYLQVGAALSDWHASSSAEMIPCNLLFLVVLMAVLVCNRNPCCVVSVCTFVVIISVI